MTAASRRDTKGSLRALHKDGDRLLRSGNLRKRLQWNWRTILALTCLHAPSNLSAELKSRRGRVPQRQPDERETWSSHDQATYQ